MKHLYKNQCHDDAQVWCDERFYYEAGEPTDDPAQADCKPCLEAAAAFGARAAARLNATRGAR